MPLSCRCRPQDCAASSACAVPPCGCMSSLAACADLPGAQSLESVFPDLKNFRRYNSQAVSLAEDDPSIMPLLHDNSLASSSSLPDHVVRGQLLQGYVSSLSCLMSSAIASQRMNACQVLQSSQHERQLLPGLHCCSAVGCCMSQSNMQPCIHPKTCLIVPRAYASCA